MKWIIALCALRGLRRGEELGTYVGEDGPVAGKDNARRFEQEEEARVLACYLPARESTEWKHLGVEA